MWITYPGDFEIWLGNKFNNRRTERGAMFPPFWKQDSHYVTVEFSTTVNIDEAEEVEILCEGQFNLMLDGKLQFGMPEVFTVPAGEHKLNLKVWNQATPPALYIKGKTITTDSSWLATYEDKIWIDENGIAHGSGIYVPAATSKYFQMKEQKPSQFALATEPMMPVCKERVGEGILYDFGKETMGFLSVANAKDLGLVEVYYGESREEALDKDFCETLDKFETHDFTPVILDSKAFRYVYVECAGEVEKPDIYAFYEYLEQDLEQSGAFECSDSELNRIWEVGAYTMDLTTREFMMDGIKRDRWTWSGDAIQSYLMNYYLRFDSECVKRTIRQLRGKDPVTAHVNTIMDYTFYWFKSVLDYYEYTADVDFVREMWPRMKTLMDYVLGRLDDEGLAEGQPDDWIFVDWVDFPMHKRGVMSFEQILLAKALETMKVCAELLGDEDAGKYATLYNDVRKKTDWHFWDDDRKSYLHIIEDGQLNEMVTKFPNMFAILFGYADVQRCKDIMEHVMLNPDVEAITTPYMRFYELEALCQMGMYDYVMGEMKSYWGGMLKEGATSFWEKYVPTEKGTQHLQMYGRPYGKSLCHAWGASPVYLLGKYYLGIKPVKPGYKEWECRPHLGGLEWMKGRVPTPFGPIYVEMNQKEVIVQSPVTGGKLYVGDKCVDINTTEKIRIGLS